MIRRGSKLLKICKWLYINPLLLALVALCYITRQLETLLITYFIMLCHELAHLAAAIFIGLKPSYIALHPFGVNLRLKNKIVCSLSDEIILYSAGPLLNIAFALAAAIFYKYSRSANVFDFYIKNICLFALNMLPVLPLDGGVILKKIIMYKKGFKYAQNVMTAVSVILICALLAAGAYFVYANNMNPSILILTIFMAGNIFTQREKYNIDFIREIIFYKNKNYKNKPVKIYAVSSSESYSDISLKFDMQNFYIVFFIKAGGEIDDILTETEILNRLTAQNVCN